MLLGARNTAGSALPCGRHLPAAVITTRKAAAATRVSRALVRPVAAMVVPGLPIPFPLTELTEFLGAVENEIALESSLHVSTIQALPCEAEFGAHLLRVAPSHHSSDSSSYISAFEQLPSPKLKSLAACLATPTEAAETPEREGMRTGSSSAVRTAGTASSTPNIRPYEALQSLQDADIAQPSVAQQRWTRVLRRMRRRRYVEQIKALFMALPAPSMRA